MFCIFLYDLYFISNLSSIMIKRKKLLPEKTKAFLIM